MWAVNDGVKVDRDARDHPARNANSAWDGRRVRVFAARNEVLAFQLGIREPVADEESAQRLPTDCDAATLASRCEALAETLRQ